MAKWLVTFSDGRQIHCFARSDDEAMRQANHAETTRIQIAAVRALNAGAPPPISMGEPLPPGLSGRYRTDPSPPANAVTAQKVKD